MATTILRPNGDTGFINIDGIVPGAPTTHYDKVDEIVADDYTTYLYMASYDSLTDYFQIPDPALSGTITNVAVHLRGMARNGALYFMLRPAGSAGYIKAAVVSVSAWTDADSGTEWALNPYTGLPWTWDDINNLEIGVQMSAWDAGGEDYARTTQVWVEVEYSPIVASTVTTDPASAISAIAATLNGTLDGDGGEACDCGFEWGETIAYGNTTPTQSRTTGQTFAQTITGLDPKKTYHFRALANNSVGTGYGADRTFTALATAATVVTSPAIDITNVAAALNGDLSYDGGEACDCGFQWGETIAYGNTTPTQSRTTGQTFAQLITGLDANKTYHFRALATNAAGTSYGADRTFTTLVSAPTVTTDPATGLGAEVAALNGTLDDDIGEACQCGFEWGLDTGYGVLTPTESKTTGEPFTQVTGGLVPNTTYHFRTFARNSFGTGYGTDRSFTTALIIRRAYALAREEL